MMPLFEQRVLTFSRRAVVKRRQQQRQKERGLHYNITAKITVIMYLAVMMFQNIVTIKNCVFKTYAFLK